MPILLLFLLATPSVSPEAHAKTKLLAQRATASYAAGKFAAALTHFEQAYEIEALPSLLFDIAQCHRALGHWRLAADFYQRYLNGTPVPTNAAKVRTLLSEAEKKAGEVTPAPAAEPEPPPAAAPAAATPAASASSDNEVPPAGPMVAAPRESPPAPELTEAQAERPASSHRGMPAGALALVIGGGVVLAAGIVLGAINLSLDAQNNHQSTPVAISRSQGQLEDTAGSLALPLNIVGGAALAGGLGWWLFSK